MAKSTAKSSVAKAPAKKAAQPKAPKTQRVTSDIEKVTEEALTKLKSLNIEPGLQADIEWCLGSYRADKNPIGLFDMINRAISIFKAELQKKTKGVNAKLILDLEKALPQK